MNLPNLKALRMFDASARHLNFRRAAEELNLTQGAVAQQVRKLEKDLGVKLFHRLARGLALTDPGATYHAEICNALSIIDEATRKIAPDSTTITLSVTPSFASKWLVPRLALFTQSHPDIEIHIQASEAIANFHSDGVDIAVRIGQPPFGKQLNVKLLSHMNLRAVSSPSYAEHAVKICQFEDLAAYRLIQDGHKLWEKLFVKAKLSPPEKMMTFNQTALAMDAAKNGQGIALAPSLLLVDQLAQGKLVELWRDDQANKNGYYLVYPNHHHETPSRNRVVEWLSSEAQKSSI